MSRFAGVFESDIPFGSVRDDSISGVLHVASTTDPDLPVLHYWVQAPRRVGGLLPPILR